MLSWRNIHISNCYENSRNYGESLGHGDGENSNYESHLIKNSEWGAVAYLAHSQYGRNGMEIINSNNSNYYTGGDQALNTIYETNTDQSSTGNETGIYDLSGNVSEYVAGYNKAYEREGDYFGGTGGNTSVYRPRSVGNGNISHFAYNLNESSNKYVTAYNNNTTTAYGDFTDKDVSHDGDGIHEVLVSSLYGWFSDHLRFVNLARPFLQRGGDLDLSIGSGNVFRAYDWDGHADYFIGFRVVLVP